MKGLCPNCEKETDLTLVTKLETYTIKGREVSINSEFYVCNECKEEFTNPGQMEKSLREGYNKYNEITMSNHFR